MIRSAVQTTLLLAAIAAAVAKDTQVSPSLFARSKPGSSTLKYYSRAAVVRGTAVLLEVPRR